MNLLLNTEFYTSFCLVQPVFVLCILKFNGREYLRIGFDKNCESVIMIIPGRGGMGSARGDHTLLGFF